MADNETAQTVNKEKKLLDLKPIVRRYARDFSHMERQVEVVLQTDETQRFLEQYVARSLGDFKFLSYSFINMRDNNFSRPLCDEITRLLSEFETQVIACDNAMKDQLAQYESRYKSVSEPSFDKVRAYGVNISSFHGSKLMNSLSALDDFFVSMHKASLNGLVDPFQEVDIRTQWINRLKEIRRRVSDIVQEVRKHTEELREQRQRVAQERVAKAEAEQRALSRKQEERKKQSEPLVEQAKEEPVKSQNEDQVDSALEKKEEN